MPSDDATRFVKVDFSRFKAFKKFSLSLRHFNILVGPNNAGKSTILAAFRILAAGMRKAYSRKSEVINGPKGMGPTHGYQIDLSSISVAEENLFYNYDDSESATIRFKLSNSNELILYFPEQGTCYLIANSEGRSNFTPATFKSHFNCRIGFVPILGRSNTTKIYTSQKPQGWLCSTTAQHATSEIFGTTFLTSSMNFGLL